MESLSKSANTYRLQVSIPDRKKRKKRDNQTSLEAEFATTVVDFLHKVGRTARAGQAGLVTSHVQIDIGKGSRNPSWVRSLPHVIVAALSSFLFGYHLGVVNDTLETISVDLNFHGDTMAKGLVVSTCLGGAFLGSTVSGWIADGIGRRRSFQLCAIPLIIGASTRLSFQVPKGHTIGEFLWPVWQQLAAEF